MPVHDWSKVEAGIFHGFHHFWLTTISATLNSGVLPADYYALPDQVAGLGHPDVLTLEETTPKTGRRSRDGSGGTTTAVLPEVAVDFEDVADRSPRLRRKLVTIRHVSGDNVVAVIEIVSPANKDGRLATLGFAAKLSDYISSDIHLLVVDLFPPGRTDPNGIHPLIWRPFKKKLTFALPAGRLLTLASYVGGDPAQAFVEPVAVGTRLPNMPLFLTRESGVNVPLEKTYAAAWALVPQRWRDELAPPA